MSDYNGWTNYETWCVNLWLTNEPNDLDERAREHLEASDFDKGSATSDLADELKTDHEELMPEVTGVFADLLTSALGEVNWHEIAAHFVDEVRVYVAGWNMPGYMPDSEPACFLDAADAMEYIREQVRESDEENAEEQADSMRADSKGEYGQTFGAYHYFVTLE